MRPIYCSMERSLSSFHMALTRVFGTPQALKRIGTNNYGSLHLNGGTTCRKDLPICDPAIGLFYGTPGISARLIYNTVVRTAFKSAKQRISLVARIHRLSPSRALPTSVWSHRIPGCYHLNCGHTQQQHPRLPSKSERMGSEISTHDREPLTSHYVLQFPL